MDTTFKTTVNAGNVVTERILTDKCFNVQIKTRNSKGYCTILGNYIF